MGIRAGALEQVFQRPLPKDQHEQQGKRHHAAPFAGGLITEQEQADRHPEIAVIPQVGNPDHDAVQNRMVQVLRNPLDDL